MSKHGKCVKKGMTICHIWNIWNRPYRASSSSTPIVAMFSRWGALTGAAAKAWSLDTGWGGSGQGHVTLNMEQKCKPTHFQLWLNISFLHKRCLNYREPNILNVSMPWQGEPPLYFGQEAWLLKVPWPRVGKVIITCGNGPPRWVTAKVA